MAHAIADETRQHMGLPMPNGKLAMWLFLVTEIMFFTALIGTYVLFRAGQPSTREPWPSPDDVHLVEWIGAFNTFVLICSSLSVVLAHYYLHVNRTGRAVQFIALTLALGIVFLGVKAYEYKSKFEHEILPGRIPEKLDGPQGYRYLTDMKRRLEHLVKDPHHPIKPEAKAKIETLLANWSTLTPKQLNYEVAGSSRVKPVDLPAGVDPQTKHEGLLDLDHNLHLPVSIPYGNLWASCYFAMTGFHALHVIGGLVIFGIMLVMAMLGRFGPQHEGLVENVGLYWHFVDIVWIFLFPLLYLV